MLKPPTSSHMMRMECCESPVDRLFPGRALVDKAAGQAEAHGKFVPWSRA